MIFKNPKKEFKGKIEDYPLENYPDYRLGMLPDTEAISKISYLDEVERIYGKRWGAQGIGRLREAALIRPPDTEFSPLWEKDRTFFLLKEKLNKEQMIKTLESYARLLEGEGVHVHWMEVEDPMGAYGPMRNNFMGGAILAVSGGVILPRYGYSSWIRGRNKNFLKFFAKIGCPILLTISGEGICEPGVWVQVAEDVLFGNMGSATNQDGLDQVLPVLRRAGYKEIHIAHCTTLHEKFESAGEFHMDMVFGVADLGVALVYPGHLDYQTFKWLRDRKFKIVEIPPDEQLSCYPANLMILEPGKVILPAGAKQTARKLKDLGVEVIEFDTASIHTGINGLRCVTMSLIRDKGPYIDDYRS